VRTGIYLIGLHGAQPIASECDRNSTEEDTFYFHGDTTNFLKIAQFILHKNINWRSDYEKYGVGEV